MKELENIRGKKVLLGVSGSIAAYKAAALVSTLSKAGLKIQVVMTDKATDLVGPQTFQALSGFPVLLDTEEKKADHAMDHIASARWADVMYVCPCTANTLGNLANGMASNLLETLYLAFEGPIIIAPAMNPAMWAKASVQRNVDQLIQDGCVLVNPESGSTACGEQGVGRLADEAELIKHLSDLF